MHIFNESILANTNLRFLFAGVTVTALVLSIIFWLVLMKRMKKDTFFKVDDVTSLGCMSLKSFKDTVTYTSSNSVSANKMYILAIGLHYSPFLRSNTQYKVVMSSLVERLKGVLRTTEFVTVNDKGVLYIILPCVNSEESLYDICEMITKSLSSDVSLSKRMIGITSYIGAARRVGNKSIDTVMSEAYTTMMELEKTGLSGYRLYKTSTGLVSDITVPDLRRALDNEEFELYYQPKVSVKTGKITGVEALLRWNHPVLGLVYPDRFIALAEMSQFMDDLTNWVVLEACKTARSWEEHNITVAVNISGAHIKTGKVLDILDRGIRLTRVPTKFINLEITETVSISDKAETLNTINRISDKGFSISIDDFGVGQTSLAYLRSYPVDFIKLDRLFITDVMENAASQTMILNIISMIHNQGYRVVAEGVETKEQLDFLVHAGCDEIQGYYISKPVPLATVETLFRKQYINGEL